MIALDTTLRKLEVVLAGAITTNQLQFVACYQDSTVAPPATVQGTTNSTTAVTLVSAPASGVQRRLKFLSIYNADTVSATVKVRLNDNATLRTIINLALPSGSTLIFIFIAGWFIIPTTGGGGGGTANFIAAIAASSTNFTITSAGLGTLYKITTGSSTITATLPAAAADFYVLLEKADSGSGVIATSPACVNSSFFSNMEQNDVMLVYSDGTSYYALALPASFDANPSLFPLMYAIASLKL